MHARYYALALLQFLTEHPRVEADGVVERLKKVLERRGHVNLLPRIISEFEKESAKTERAKNIVATVATEKDRAEALQQAAVVAEEKGLEKSQIGICVDPGLIGGFSLRGPGFRYDNSQKTKLKELYKSLTA